MGDWTLDGAPADREIAIPVRAKQSAVLSNPVAGETHNGRVAGAERWPGGKRRVAVVAAQSRKKEDRRRKAEAAGEKKNRSSH